MPQIPVYNAPENLHVQLDDRASSAHTMAARRIGIAYQQAGNVIARTGAELGQGVAAIGKAENALEEQQENLAAHNEQVKGTAAFSTLIMNTEKAWNDMLKSSDISDGTIAKRFNEGVVEPSLQKFREAFRTEKGQQWADEQIAKFRQHVFEKTSADMSTLAGHAQVLSASRSIDSLAGAVNLAPDEHTLDNALEQNKAAAKTFSEHPNLSGLDAQRLQADVLDKGNRAIVRSAIESAILKNPDKGMELARNPKYAPYIDAPEIQRFEKDARQSKRLQEIDARADRQEQRIQAEQTNHDILKDLAVDLASPNPQHDRQWILDNKAKFTEPGFEHAIAMYDRYTKPETDAKISQRNARELSTRIWLPPGDPQRLSTINEIIESYNKGGLTQRDRNDLLQTFEQARTPEGQKWSSARKDFFDAVKPMILKSEIEGAGGGQSLKWYEFQQTFDREAERLGVNDRYKLLRPGTAEYMGKQEVINPYVVPFDLWARQTRERAATPPAKKDNRPPISQFGR